MCYPAIRLTDNAHPPSVSIQLEVHLASHRSQAALCKLNHRPQTPVKRSLSLSKYQPNLHPPLISRSRVAVEFYLVLFIIVPSLSIEPSIILPAPFSASHRLQPSSSPPSRSPPELIHRHSSANRSNRDHFPVNFKSRTSPHTHQFEQLFPNSHLRTAFCVHQPSLQFMNEIHFSIQFSYLHTIHHFARFFRESSSSFSKFSNSPIVRLQEIRITTSDSIIAQRTSHPKGGLQQTRF